MEKVAGLLGGYRLVTVVGAGGVGKTRLAAEVARRVAGRFADGGWLVELAAVQEPALVPAAVAAVFGVSQPPGMSIMESLVGVLARRQLLLMLDNCEHVLGAVAELCGGLLASADDVRVLATSREPCGIGGEARYRLRPLAVPVTGATEDTGDGNAAVVLFADRARQADPAFALTGESGSLVAQIVARLDGMPLAIELAAARVEALGLGQLLERLDHRFQLLTGGDRTAAARQRSLVATVEWSYRLLSEPERQVFRRLAVFPAPFTLNAAEAVAGPAAEPVVLHLVDCSLLVPPLAGPDGRARYAMLETLRVFGLDRLAEAGEQSKAAANLAEYALVVTEQAAAGLNSGTGEAAGARWLDAEDAAVQQALTWALEHDAPTALRLAVALAPWWRLRGRSAEGRVLLQRATKVSGQHDRSWFAAQVWLGYLAQVRSDFAAALGHFTAACDAPDPPSRELVDGLAGRSGTLRNLGRLSEATKDAQRALRLARQIGYPAGEVMALMQLSAAADYAGDAAAGLEWARLAQQSDPASIPGWVTRRCAIAWALGLTYAGQGSAAEQVCADMLAMAHAAGDVGDQADFHELIVYIAYHTGHIAGAGEHLREAIRLATQTGNRVRLVDCLDNCGHLCAATARPAEALTLWAAYATHNAAIGVPEMPQDAHSRQEPLRQAAQSLGPGPTRAAQERGAAMTLPTATDFAAMLASPAPPEPSAPSQTRLLSARERELVTLVAQGQTDAQIAGQLYISVRTVRSHLDRIRDKTGHRRRADLTRLALQVGLV
jgi:predicted ATPase/DNA-binding CsgD family transcriptional regulator